MTGKVNGSASKGGRGREKALLGPWVKEGGDAGGGKECVGKPDQPSAKSKLDVPVKRQGTCEPQEAEDIGVEGKLVNLWGVWRDG